MCLAVPGKVVEIKGKTVMIDYGSEKRRALVGDGKVKIGDYVMVQMGVIINKIPPSQARLALNAWKSRALRS